MSGCQIFSNKLECSGCGGVDLLDVLVLNLHHMFTTHINTTPPLLCNFPSMDVHQGLACVAQQPAQPLGTAEHSRRWRRRPTQAWQHNARRGPPGTLLFMPLLASASGNQRPVGGHGACEMKPSVTALNEGEY